MVSPLLEDVYDATQEEIEEDYMTLGFADEEDVGVLRVGVHCSNPAHWQTNVPAQLAGHPSLLETVDQDFSLAPFVVFLVDILLEASSEVRVGAVPADICAREISFLLASLSSVDRESIDQSDLLSLHFPKTTPSVLAAGSPLMAPITPLYLHYFLMVSLYWIERRQRYLLASDSALHGFLECRHHDHKKLACLKSNQDMCLLRGQGDHNNGGILLFDDLTEAKYHEIRELESS